MELSSVMKMIQTHPIESAVIVLLVLIFILFFVKSFTTDDMETTYEINGHTYEIQDLEDEYYEEEIQTTDLEDEYYEEEIQTTDLEDEYYEEETQTMDLEDEYYEEEIEENDVDSENNGELSGFDLDTM